MAKRHIARNIRGEFTKLDEMRQRTAAIARMQLLWGAKDNPHGDSGLTSAQLLKIHEFGIGVPERSVVRYVKAAHRDKIADAFKHAVVQVITRGWGPDQVAEYVGDIVVELMRQRIESGIPPELAASTRANPDRDPRHIPLLDTEQLYRDLAWFKRDG